MIGLMDDQVPEFSPRELTAIREATDMSLRGLEDAIGLRSNGGYLSKVERGLEKLSSDVARVYLALRDGQRGEELRAVYLASKFRTSKRTEIVSEEVVIQLNEDRTIRVIFRRILLRAHRKVSGQPLFLLKSEENFRVVAALGGQLEAGEWAVGMRFPKPVLPGEEHFIELVVVPEADPPRPDDFMPYLVTTWDWYDLQRLTMMLWVPVALSEQTAVLRVDGLQPHAPVNALVTTPLNLTTNGLARTEFKDLAPGLFYGLVWQ